MNAAGAVTSGSVGSGVVGTRSHDREPQKPRVVEQHLAELTLLVNLAETARGRAEGFANRYLGRLLSKGEDPTNGTAPSEVPVRVQLEETMGRLRSALTALHEQMERIETIG